MTSLALALLIGAVAVQAATVWDGPLMTFTEPAGGSGSNPADQDRLTADVWITRDVTHGLYNAFAEVGYTAFYSPGGTEWSYGNLANYATLTYTNWQGMFGGNSGGGPRSTLNIPTVLHLINEDIYLSVTLTAWGGSAGGFTYQRSTPHGTVFPIPLQATFSPNRIVLTWSDASFSLQSATNAAGPYTTIAGATSPYTNTLSSKQLYFRLIH